MLTFSMFNGFEQRLTPSVEHCEDESAGLEECFNTIHCDLKHTIPAVKLGVYNCMELEAVTAIIPSVYLDIFKKHR